MDFIQKEISNAIFTTTGIKFGDEELRLFLSFLYSLICSFLLNRTLIPSEKFSRNFKLYVSAFIGIYLSVHNWGWIICLPLFEVLLSFAFLKLLSLEKACWSIFILSMGCLTIGNILITYIRLFTDIAPGAADFSGTIMVLTQRLTSFSCSLYDGLCAKDENLTTVRKKQAIRKQPTFAELFSYTFSFLGILTGPLVFYNDYINIFDSEQKDKPKTNPAVSRFLKGLSLTIFFIFVSDIFPNENNSDPEFMKSNSLLYRCFYLYISLLTVRCKYYGVWIIGEGIFNGAGIGYQGNDAHNNKELWDGANNIKPLEIELATGMKTYIDNWNISTVKWIRLVAYDRIEKYKTIMSFLLSAFWHGFFPGYYIMFATTHLFLITQKKFRRSYRHLFVNSHWLNRIYQVVTWFFVQSAVSYMALSFVTLEYTASMRFYRSVYFVGHIIAVLVYLISHYGKKKIH